MVMVMVKKKKKIIMTPFNFVPEYVISKFKENQEKVKLNDQNPVFVEFLKSFKI